MNGARVWPILLLDAALAGTGAWMIYDHVRRPAQAAVAAQATADAAPVAAASPPAPAPAPVPAPAPAPRRDPTPTAIPTPAERPQPQRPSANRLPDKPSPLPVQTFPDAGAPPLLPPILRVRPPETPDAAPPPPPPPPPEEPPPEQLPPDAAAVDPSTPDPWVESMTRGIRSVVEGHRELIEDCYVRAAKEGTRESPIQGRVEVHLTIVPSGDAEDVRVVENQTGSEELGTCLVAIMRTWRYPAPGEAMEFVWPFNFQARRGETP